MTEPIEGYVVRVMPNGLGCMVIVCPTDAELLSTLKYVLIEPTTTITVERLGWQ